MCTHRYTQSGASDNIYLNIGCSSVTGRVRFVAHQVPDLLDIRVGIKGGHPKNDIGLLGGVWSKTTPKRMTYFLMVTYIRPPFVDTQSFVVLAVIAALYLGLSLMDSLMAQHQGRAGKTSWKPHGTQQIPPRTSWSSHRTLMENSNMPNHTKFY